MDDLADHFFRHTGNTATVKAVARFNNPTLDDKLRAYNVEAGTFKTIHSFPRVTPEGHFPVGYNPPSQSNLPILLADSGQVFQIGLGSRIRSHPAWNQGGQDQMVTFEIIGKAGHPENSVGNYVVGWEAFPRDDLDYQDLVYEISGAAPVPEPGSGAVFLSTWVAAIGPRRRARS
ncbi:MAG: hypothetical protein AB7G28_17585 [Pirellulales bacterium]